MSLPDNQRERITREQLATIMPALKGAQLSILVTFMLSEFCITYGANDLATIIGYSRQATSQALQSLAAKGLVQNIVRYNGWVLTANARQLLLLPEMDEMEREGKYSTLPLSSSSSLYTLEKEEDIYLSKEEKTTTTTTQSEGKNFTLPLEDSHIQEIVQYFQQNGIVKKSYQGALLNTLNADWSTQRTNTAFRFWLHFTEDPKHNINSPPFYIIARLRDLDPPPINEKSPCLFCDTIHEQYYHHGLKCPECGGCPKCCTCNQNEDHESQED